MSHKNKTIDPDIHFRVLHVLEEKPSITQRELARKLGISLGSVNFCLRELMNVGQIKVDNFKKNPDKSVYLYLLTPQGLKQKALLTAGFLKRKLEEYHALKIEIESVQTRIEN